jgi:C4-dicarboxylate transporter DctM subunit
MIFLILLGADVMNVFLALTQMPTELAKWVVGLGLSPLLVMLVIISSTWCSAASWTACR